MDAGFTPVSFWKKEKKQREKTPGIQADLYMAYFCVWRSWPSCNNPSFFFDCGFFAWSITSPMAFACAYLQTSLSLGLTSQSL